MVFFSAASETAIRLLTYVHARSLDGKRMGVPEIARHTDTPQSYAAKIMQVLSRKGLVNSYRGMHGGFYLDHSLPEITIYSIVEAIDGIGFLQGCGLGLKNCVSQHPCPMHDDFMVIRSKMELSLKTTTIALLAEKYLENKSYLSVNDQLLPSE